MKTIAECVGGAYDGVQLDPHDPDEPDDWSDYIELLDKQTGKVESYAFESRPPRIRDGFRVYRYLLLRMYQYLLLRDD